MNREDIARMYQEANGWNPLGYVITMGELERFAVLVASAEREACLKLADSLGWVNVDHIRARGQA